MSATELFGESRAVPVPTRPPAWSSSSGEFSADFFVLRTPLLPFETFTTWGAAGAAAVADAAAPSSGGLAALRAELGQKLAAPEARAALALASPETVASWRFWTQDPHSERGHKVERALVRYLARMVGRATPFGLLAGCSLGEVGRETQLQLAPRQQYRRFTRLQGEYQGALVAHLEALPALRQRLHYHPNSSLCQLGRSLRYTEVLSDSPNEPAFPLIELEPSAALQLTLARAGRGAPGEVLAAALANDHAAVPLTEWRLFVAELITNQVLVSELSTPISGDTDIRALVAHVERILARPGSGGQPAAAHESAALLLQLRAVADRLQQLDTQTIGSVPPDFAPLPPSGAEPLPLPSARGLHIDLYKPVARAVLGAADLTRILKGVRALHRLMGRQSDSSIRDFRLALVARYEGQPVRLVEALDDDFGVGFERASGPGQDPSPLLAGVDFTPAAEDASIRWTARQQLIMQKLGAALQAGQDELVFCDADLAGLPEPLPLPQAFAAQALLLAPCGNPSAAARVVIDAVYGPSGANLLGRFCPGSPALESRVRQHLAAEAAHQPECIYAEVIHLPAGRLANLVQRPVLREFEIPFLGHSGAPPERQIPLDDLWVMIKNDQVILRSARLGRQVIPRLTSAHNYRAPKNLAIYRFLGALATQGVTAELGWRWHPLEDLDYLPRVRYQDVILARARWCLRQDTLLPLRRGSPAAALAQVAQLRQRLKWPRLVTVARGDNRLPIDLDNPLSVEGLVHHLRSLAVAHVEEYLPTPEQLCCEGPEGRYVHEVIVPLLRTCPPPRPVPPPAPPLPVTTSALRRFPPGSPWLYVKLYGSAMNTEQALGELFTSTIAPLVARGTLERWFFIRYADPRQHLRLRFQGHAQQLLTEVYPAILRVLQPLLDDGRVSRVQLDTYEREIERYGGLDACVHAERIFHADSEAALALLRSDLVAPADDRPWQLALLSLDALFSDLQLSLPERLQLLELQRARLRKLLGPLPLWSQQVGRKFRAERRRLEALLAPSQCLPAHAPQAVAGPLDAARLTLMQRSQRVRPVFALLQAQPLPVSFLELAASYIHMAANRLLRSSTLAQECLLYEYLSRLYLSRTAQPALQPAGTD